MPCLSFDFQFPDLPDLFVALPLVPNLPLPASFDFCCHFELPDVLGLNAAIAVINAAIGAIGGEANAIAAMAAAEILAAAAPILNLAISVAVECPIDTVSP